MGMWLLIHAGIKINPCWYNGPQMLLSTGTTAPQIGVIPTSQDLYFHPCVSCTVCCVYWSHFTQLTWRERSAHTLNEALLATKTMGAINGIDPIGIARSFIRIVQENTVRCCCNMDMVWYIRADSRFAPSQWETSLQSNAVSHWLGANLESALYIVILHTWCSVTGRTSSLNSLKTPNISLLRGSWCIEAETKWRTISWRHFQMHVLEWKYMNFD